MTTSTLTEAAGKTRAVTAAGIGDIKNEITLYSIVEAATRESADRAFARRRDISPRRSL
jgi:hypothetical protein